MGGAIATDVAGVGTSRVGEDLAHWTYVDCLIQGSRQKTHLLSRRWVDGLEDGGREEKETHLVSAFRVLMIDFGCTVINRLKDLTLGQSSMASMPRLASLMVHQGAFEA
jgi:hypothetical protein